MMIKLNLLLTKILEDGILIHGKEKRFIFFVEIVKFKESEEISYGFCKS